MNFSKSLYSVFSGSTVVLLALDKRKGLHFGVLRARASVPDLGLISWWGRSNEFRYTLPPKELHD